MKKIHLSVLIGASVLVIVGLGLFGYVTYLTITENYMAEGVTIRVLTTPNIIVDVPITETIIRLESEDGRSAIQNMTDLKGEVFFRRITPGMYRIHATQVQCKNEKPASTISVNIYGSNVNIDYVPCI